MFLSTTNSTIWSCVTQFTMFHVFACHLFMLYVVIQLIFVYLSILWVRDASDRYSRSMYGIFSSFPSHLLSSLFFSSLPPCRNSDRGSNLRFFSPPLPYGSCHAFLSREDFSSFIPRRLASNCTKYILELLPGTTVRCILYKSQTGTQKRHSLYINYTIRKKACSCCSNGAGIIRRYCCFTWQGVPCHT